MSNEEIKRQKMEALLEMSEAQLEENRIAVRAHSLAAKFKKASELLRGMDDEFSSIRPEAFATVAEIGLPDTKTLQQFANEATESRARWREAVETKKKLGLV